MPQGQPFGSGTAVKFQPRNDQGQPEGSPYEGIVEGQVLSIYFPLPDGTYAKKQGTWDGERGCWEFINGDLYILPGPPLGFSWRQGTLQTSHGTCQAVA